MSAPSRKCRIPSAKTGARSLVTLIDAGTPVPRPSEIAEDAASLCSDVRYRRRDRRPYSALGLPCRRIARFRAAMGPRGADADSLLRRGQPLDRGGLRRGLRAEPVIATKKRSPPRSGAIPQPRRPMRGSSPSAMRCLRRGGRMNAAIAKIGRGAECYEGKPFALELH